MEAASATARPTTPLWSRVTAAAGRFLSRYGLILVLFVLPVWFGIKDLNSEGDLSNLANNLKDGLSNGAIWALIALGYTLVYGIIELINFAHGDVFMIGSFVAVGLYGTFGLAQSTGTIGLAAGLLVVLLLSMFIFGGPQPKVEAGGHPPPPRAAHPGPPVP